MNKNIYITASIVLFNEDLKELENTVSCFLNVKISKKLYLIDNTLNGDFKGLFHHQDIEYIAVPSNIGFGAGHNKALKYLKDKSDYHLILNPDVSFKPKIITTLISQLELDNSTAMIAPKVLFPDGRHQYSCRRYPTVSELLARRFTFLKFILKKQILKGTYRDLDLNQAFFAEYITGCFHLYKTKDFVNLKGFDERYFLYMEDVDICKKIDLMGKKKLYYPQEEIIHVLKQGSSKSFKLFLRHTFSAIKYFLKWGFR